jgi:tetratricopeptide (TPR) repeat protein
VLQPYQSKSLDIADPWVKAARTKHQNDVAKAINEYRIWGAKLTMSPLPHYFIGRLLQQEKKYTDAIAEFKKAEVKQSLVKDGWIFPEIWIAQGDVYAEDQNNVKALTAYGLASEKSQDRVDIQEQLVDKYKQINAKAESTKAAELVVKLKGQPAAK